MSEKWLPTLQKTFKVMPIHQCINDPHPYWEESFTYPTLDVPEPPRQNANSYASHSGNVANQPGAKTSMASSSFSHGVAEVLFSLSLLGFAVATTLV